jgi:hypothetical protein
MEFKATVYLKSGATLPILVDETHEYKTTSFNSDTLHRFIKDKAVPGPINFYFTQGDRIDYIEVATTEER